MTREFSLERLDALLKRFPGAFWRHDVDFSLEAALKMAHFEAERGVRATYYLFLGLNECPFYSHLDAMRAERELIELGHSIGLHVDERKLYPEWRDLFPLRGKVSFHCPTQEVLWRDFETFENAYASTWRNRYYSDSGGKFRLGDPEDYTGPLPPQVNLHAEWWFLGTDWYFDIPADVFENFFHEPVVQRG